MLKQDNSGSSNGSAQAGESNGRFRSISSTEDKGKSTSYRASPSLSCASAGSVSGTTSPFHRRAIDVDNNDNDNDKNGGGVVVARRESGAKKLGSREAAEAETVETFPATVMAPHALMPETTGSSSSFNTVPSHRKTAQVSRRSSHGSVSERSARPRPEQPCQRPICSAPAPSSSLTRTESTASALDHGASATGSRQREEEGEAEARGMRRDEKISAKAGAGNNPTFAPAGARVDSKNVNTSSNISGGNTHEEEDFSVRKQTNYLQQRSSHAGAGNSGSRMNGSEAGPYPEALPGVPMEIIGEQQHLADSSAHSRNQASANSGMDPNISNASNAPPSASSVIVAHSADNAAVGGTNDGNGSEWRSQDWATGLFDCSMDLPLFADAIFCSYCLSSTQYNWLYREQRGIFFPLCAGMVCIDFCLATSFYCVIANQVHTFVVRRELRRRYGIWDPLRAEEGTSTHHDNNDNNHNNGNENSQNAQEDGAVVSAGTYQPTLRSGFVTTLKDLAASFCCAACAMSQHYREITAQGQWCGPVVFSRTATTFPAAPNEITIM